MAANLTLSVRSLLASLTNDGKQSAATYLTAVGLLGVALLIHKLSNPHTDAREPPLLKPGLPVIGHLIGLLRYEGSYLKSLYDASHHRIVTLPILGGKMYVIFDGATMQSAYRNKHLRFEPFAVEFGQRQLNISDASFKIVRETDLISEFFKVIHPAMTGAPLHRMNANALKYVSGRLEDIGSDGKALKIPNLYLWVRDLMTLATTEALYGPDNPIGVKQSLLDDVWTFESGLSMLLLNIMPSVTARAAHNARSRLQEALSAYYAAGKDRHEDAAQVIKDRANLLRSYGIPDAQVGYFELAMLHVATANTVPTLFWLMAHVFSDPDLVSRLRQEVLPAVQRDTDTNQSTIDITKLEDKCPVLVSCYREVIRLSSQAVGNRRPVEDTTVSDSNGNTYLLKKDCNVQMSAEVLHTLEGAWGDNVLAFNAERFVKKGGRDNSEREKAKQLAYVPFGGGRHLCPGRNFAFAENLGFLTALLLGFEVMPFDEGASEMKLPGLRKCSFSEAAAKPVNNGEGFGIRIQKREGWESEKWLFVC